MLLRFTHSPHRLFLPLRGKVRIYAIDHHSCMILMSPSSPPKKSNLPNKVIKFVSRAIPLHLTLWCWKPVR
eukprot:scaffold3481_cov115-Cylindrotheca_fusiformis.AAC.2